MSQQTQLQSIGTLTISGELVALSRSIFHGGATTEQRDAFAALPTLMQHALQQIVQTNQM